MLDIKGRWGVLDEEGGRERSDGVRMASAEAWTASAVGVGTKGIDACDGARRFEAASRESEGGSEG